jgi:hypothetical protein
MVELINKKQHKIKIKEHYYSWCGVKLSPLGTSAINGFPRLFVPTGTCVTEPLPGNGHIRHNTIYTIHLFRA